MDYDKLIAPAAKAMRPSGIRKFFDLAAEMPECISLGVGEPDFKTPWAVREAGIESLEHGRTRYTAIARHRNADTAKAHKDMGFFDGWGTVATQLEAYAQGLAK